VRLRAAALWLRTAIWFLVRSGRSTFVLSIMVFLSVATLIFLSSLAVGVNDAMVRNSAQLYAGHIAAQGLPGALLPTALEGSGVAGVVKRVPHPGALERGARVAWGTLVASDPTREQMYTGLVRKLVAGRMPKPGGREILLGGPVAETLGAHTGDEVAFRPDLASPPVTLSVAGIYRTGVDAIDRVVALCPSSALPNPGGTWSAAVFLEDGASAEAVAGRLRAAIGPPAVFRTWVELMPDLKQLIDLNYVSMTLVTLIVFGLVALGVSCAFVIFILKNLREYGILKAMGVTPVEMVSLIVTEVTLLNLVSLAAGVLLGVVAVACFRGTGIDLTAFTSHNRYFAVSGVVFPRLTPYSLWVPPAVAFAFSLAASLWPAGTVVRSKAADVLRGG
jgi:ABC-type lipoprotein release transport system permease subunit